MEGKEDGRANGARHAEALQDGEDQDRRRRVQRDVEDVIAERHVSNKVRHDPEGRVHHRIVLLRCAGLEPDAPEAAPVSKIEPRDMRLVVPQDAAVESGLVHGEKQDQDGDIESHIAPCFGAYPRRRARDSRSRSRSWSRRLVTGVGTSHLGAIPVYPADRDRRTTMSHSMAAAARLPSSHAAGGAAGAARSA